MKFFSTRLVIVLLSLFTISASSYAQQHEYTPGALINGLYYILNDATLEASLTSPNFNVISCYGMSSITVPSEVKYNKKTYKVTSIDRDAIKRESALTSITIPNTVLWIGEWAFYDWENLTSVTLPGSLRRIERGVFNNCKSLKQITLPEGITQISPLAFGDCENLTSIVLPSSIDFISTSAFDNCNSLKTVTVKSATPIEIYAKTFAVYGDLHVPAGSKAAYKNAAIWKKFNIIEEGEATGISNLNANHSSQNIYSLSGTHLYAPRKGVNIINGKKVVIK